jgi:hypothetical protein
MHKGVKCHDVNSSQIYISRDVVFYEIVFPFARLHPNAGALLQREILLLPESLQNQPVSSNEGEKHCTDVTPNDSIIPGGSSSTQVQQDVEKIPCKTVQKQGKTKEKQQCYWVQAPGMRRISLGS